MKNVRVVQEMFFQGPNKSTLQAALESGLSRHTIRTVLKEELQFGLWKPLYCQELSVEDCDHLVENGEIILGRQEDWPELFHILWSDQAMFHVGFVNRHNCHY